MRAFKITETLVKNILQVKAFRFILSGGTATMVDVGTYFICLHYIFKAPINIFGLKASIPVISLMVSYSTGFLTNFIISKLFVFQGSDLRTRIQLLRFFMVAVAIFCMNYVIFKLLLNFEIYPTVARLMSAAVVAFLSFLLHNSFTFKKSK
jgi:putative flippase GtrA